MADATSYRCLIWEDGTCVEETMTTGHLGPLSDPRCLVWLDIVDASPSDVRRLAQDLKLWPTEVEDAVAAHERPKVSRHGEHLFFTAYSATLGPVPASPGPDDGAALGRLELAQISGFVLPTALVTIRTHDFDMEPVLAAWRENADLIGRDHSPAALVHGLLDSIVDGHFETIQQLDDAIEDLEDELFDQRATGPAFQRQIYGLRKDLVALRRVVLPMREVVNSLLRHRLHEGTELGSWFDDLYDHVLRAAEWTESLRDMVTSVFETNLSLQDARLNVVMKKLASWAAIIAVPTAITGWFGQNVPYPGFSQESGLWLSVALIVVLSAGLYAVFRRNDWL